MEFTIFNTALIIYTIGSFILGLVLFYFSHKAKKTSTTNSKSLRRLSLLFAIPFVNIIVLIVGFIGLVKAGRK